MNSKTRAASVRRLDVRSITLLLALLLTPGIVAAEQSITLSAALVDADAKAKAHTATVQAMVVGLALVDPDSVRGVANADEGHLHYQVDDGPVIATPASKLSFHGLAAGKHTIIVTLVGNDHKPLGPQQNIAVIIP